MEENLLFGRAGENLNAAIKHQGSRLGWSAV